MKKLLAFALVLAMILTMTCTAFASVATFVLTYVTDGEGIDLEVEELPQLAVTIDDQAMTCVYATAEGEVEGTVEVLETNIGDPSGAPDSVTIQVTLASGEAIVMYVYEDQIEIDDEANDLCYILLRAKEN